MSNLIISDPDMVSHIQEDIIFIEYLGKVFCFYLMKINIYRKTREDRTFKGELGNNTNLVDSRIFIRDLGSFSIF